MERAQLTLGLGALRGELARARRVRCAELINLCVTCLHLTLLRLERRRKLGVEAPLRVVGERLGRRGPLKVALVRRTLRLPRQLERARRALALGAQPLALILQLAGLSSKYLDGVGLEASTCSRLFFGAHFQGAAAVGEEWRRR